MQAADQIIIKLAVLNELRLAIGSFAPCEVVMEGCTRVLPLVTLMAKGVGSKSAGSDRDDAGSTDDEKGVRRGVSPNRHPQARMGAANVKARRRQRQRRRCGRLERDAFTIVVTSVLLHSANTHFVRSLS